MKMMMFVAAAVALAATAPAAAQMAAGGAMPKCSATVRDSCDQSMTTEKNAMTADQAMASGGVGDRKTGGAMMAAPMPHTMPMHHKKAMRHKMATSMTKTETTEPMPK